MSVPILCGLIFCESEDEETKEEVLARNVDNKNMTMTTNRNNSNKNDPPHQKDASKTTSTKCSGIASRLTCRTVRSSFVKSFGNNKTSGESIFGTSFHNLEKVEDDDHDNCAMQNNSNTECLRRSSQSFFARLLRMSTSGEESFSFRSTSTSTQNISELEEDEHGDDNFEHNDKDTAATTARPTLLPCVSNRNLAQGRARAQFVSRRNQKQTGGWRDCMRSFREKGKKQTNNKNPKSLDNNEDSVDGSGEQQQKQQCGYSAVGTRRILAAKNKATQIQAAENVVSSPAMATTGRKTKRTINKRRANIVQRQTM